MSQTLIERRSLLVLSSFFHATFSLMILLIWSPDGLMTLRRFAHSRSSIEDLGLVAITAGVCTVAAGIWNARDANPWPLMLNGLGCSALGIMVALGATRPITLRSLALVIVWMAVSIGVYEVITAQALREHQINGWCWLRLQ